MLINILSRIFGEQNNSSNRQEPTPDVSKKSVDIDTNEDEVVRLARLHGPLASGKRIELTLQQALQEFPRKRQRSDAYNGLIKRVKAEYDTDLIITSRKSSKNGGSDV